MWLKAILFFNFCPKWFIKTKLYGTSFSVTLNREVKIHVLGVLKQVLRTRLKRYENHLSRKPNDLLTL